MLLGSSILNSHYLINDKTVALGVIVRKAFADSKLTEKEWNDLKGLDREARVAKALYQLLGIEG